MNMRSSARCFDGFLNRWSDVRVVSGALRNARSCDRHQSCEHTIHHTYIYGVIHPRSCGSRTLALSRSTPTGRSAIASPAPMGCPLDWSEGSVRFRGVAPWCAANTDRGWQSATENASPDGVQLPGCDHKEKPSGSGARLLSGTVRVRFPPPWRCGTVGLSPFRRISMKHSACQGAVAAGVVQPSLEGWRGGRASSPLSALRANAIRYGVEPRGREARWAPRHIEHDGRQLVTKIRRSRTELEVGTGGALLGGNPRRRVASGNSLEVRCELWVLVDAGSNPASPTAASRRSSRCGRRWFGAFL